MSDTTPTENTTTTRSSNPYLLPGAIIIAGIVIAGAIFMVKKPANVAVAPTGKPLEASVLPVTSEDHVFGPSNPDVYLIEYSDYQCPYCQRFHDTVVEVLKEYDGKVAWVYRHFPLDSIHPEARPAALAAECVAEQGGNDAFWNFTNQIFADQRSMSSDRYTEIAGNLGLDTNAFSTCASSDKYTSRVDRDLTNVIDLGGQGTPFSVLLTRNGDTITFSGALPIERVKVLVDRALKSVK